VIAGFPIGSAAIASYPSPGGLNPGTVSCPDDEAVFYVFGSDAMDTTLGLVFGEASATDRVSCDGGDSAEGYASGQSTTTGRVSGGDEKVG
jgi:hypothetical protein